MQEKYKQQSMQQNKKRNTHKHQTPGYNDDGKRSKDKKSIARQKRRAEQDYSLEVSRYQNLRVNETNPHDARDFNNRATKQPLSPHSRMMFQSEAQFLDNYGQGRKSEMPLGRFNQNGTADGEDNTIWDKLSKIFTFGCIETSHNNKR